MRKRNLSRSRLGAGVASALMIGALITGLPADVWAAGGLEMSTDYPGVTASAGENLSFGLDFDSLSGDSMDAALSVESIPSGWESYFSGSSGEITKVHVDSGSSSAESDLATFNLTVPDDAEEGTYSIVLGADAGGENTDTLSLDVTITTAATGSSSFSAEYPEQEGAVGSSFSFETALANNQAMPQTYSLTAEAPDGWQVSFSSDSTQVSSLDVEAASSSTVTVDITPPETAEQGDYTITCTAESANETLTMDLTVTITGTYGLEVTTSSGNLSLDAYANDEKSVTLQIKNTGNVDLENIELTSSAPSDSWEIGFDESTIDTLEAGATTEVTAYITPDSDAVTGDYMATITATADETTADAQFRITVKTRTAWGIAAVCVIVILVCGVGFVFKKYGRR